MIEDRSIPPSWARATMQDIATIVGGGTPSTSNLVFWDDGDIPWITPADLSGYVQKTISRGARNITRLGLEHSGATLLPSGAVLFSSRAPIGYLAIASNQLSTNQGFKSFVLEPGITPHYIYYYLQFAKSLAVSLASGTTFKEISGRKARIIPVVVAPTPEQFRIVEAIESYLSRLDNAVASLVRVQDKLRSYRASVLKAAVEGRLVPTEAALARAEKRAYEPAKVLLDRILKERRRRWQEAEVAKLKSNDKVPKGNQWKAKYEEPVAPDLSMLQELPEGWSWASLDQLLAEPLTNGKSVPDGNGAPVLRLTCIKSGLVDLTERKSGQWDDIDPRKFFVEADDFLIIRGNGSIHLVGRGGRVGVGPDGVAYPDTLIRARVDPGALYPPLLARWWDSSPVRKHIERRAKTTAGIYKVNQGDLGQTPVPLAPILEQTRIYDELERVDTTSIAAIVTIEAAVRRCSRLRQAILKWAFEGKLVDQDPMDEAADKLLACIRGERAVAAAPIKKSRGRAAKGAA